MNLLNYFEQKYTCSGICSPALFYYSLPLTEGVPSATCLSFLKEEIGSSLTYLGVASIVVGIVILLIFICQYALWCKYEDKTNPGAKYQSAANRN
jgi:hypothetical protein